MSLLAAALLLGQVTALAPRLDSGTLSLSGRSELRLRNVPGSDPAIDSTTSLTSNLSMTARRADYSLGYGLSFAEADLARTGDRALMQFARMSIAYGRRRFTLTLGANATYGTQVAVGVATPLRLDTPGVGGGTPTGTPATPAATAAAPATPVPSPYASPAQQISTGSLGASLGVGYSLTKRWTISGSTSGAIAGGTNFESQQTAPPSRNVFGSVGTGYKISARDQLSNRVGVSYVLVLRTPVIDGSGRKPGGGSFITTDVNESFGHAFSKRTTGTLGVGIAFVHADPDLGDTGGFHGIGNAAIAYSAPLRDQATVTLAGTGGLGTGYNPVIGIVQYQVFASAALTWSWRKLTASLNGSAAASLPYQNYNATRAVSGGIVLGYALVRAIQLQTGARVSAQVLPTEFEVPTAPDWGAFVALQLILPSWAF